MAKKRSPGSFDVGYGKPPEQSRFVKGISGNPNGRPKKAVEVQPAAASSSLSGKLLLDANQLITVRTSDGVKSMTSYDAVLQATKATALKGNPASQRLYLKQVEEAQRRDDELWAEIGWLDARSPVERKMLVKRYEDQKDDGGEYCGHPDDFRLDHKTRNVIFTGPYDWDSYRLMKSLRSYRNNLLFPIYDWSQIECSNELRTYINFRSSLRYNSARLISQLLPDRYNVGPFEETGINLHHIEGHSVDTIMWGVIMPVLPYHRKLFEAESVAAQQFLRADRFWFESQDRDYGLFHYYRPIDGKMISEEAGIKIENKLLKANSSTERSNFLYKLWRNNSLPLYVRLNAQDSFQQFKWRAENMIIEDFRQSLRGELTTVLHSPVMLRQRE